MSPPSAGSDASGHSSSSEQSDNYDKIPRPPLWLLAFMMAIGPFGDTEYTPAMPNMAQSLHADYGMVQLSMTAYLIGASLSQLIYGPLTDRYGRRPVMLVGAGILCAGLLLCVLSFSVWPLIGGRLIQGFGAVAGGVVSDAMVRDAFPKEERKRTYAKLMTAFALAPAVGPVAGTLIAKAFGWHWNFVLLLVLGLLLWALVWWLLPETHPNVDKEAMQPSRLWQHYRNTLMTREFTFFAVLSGCGVGVVYTALIGAPDLVINMLGRGSVGIIEVSASILVAFVVGAGLCALLTKVVPDWTLLVGGLVVLAGASGWLLLIALTVGKQGGLFTYLLPISGSFIGVGLLMPICTACAMAPFKDTAGMAASLLGVARMGVAALGTLAMGLLHRGAVMDMPIVFLVMTALAIAVYAAYVLTGGKREQATA